jgi:hypothetical protein
MSHVVDLTLPQSKFFFSQAEYTAAVAGFGSGKTQVACTRILATKFSYPKIDLAYLAPTYSLIEDIFYPKMAEMLSESRRKYKINKQRHTIFIDGYGKIICRTMDDPNTLVGWEVGDAFMDEFDILDTPKAKKVMQKVTARCRQKFPDGKINQKWVTTTPEGFKATYDLFKRHPMKDSRLIQMSTYSNSKNLPPEYITGLEAQYPKQLIRAYLLGEFVNLTTGSVYNFDRSLHNTETQILEGEPLHIGQDFNYGGCVSSVFVIRDKVPYLLDGYISKDTATVVKTTKQKYPNHFITFYPDSSGKNNSTNASISDLQILRQGGFRIITTKANPLIRDRVNCVNAMLDKRQFFINCANVPEHVEALERQAWDEKTGNPKKESYPASPDDYNDSIGYFIVRRFPILRPAFTTGSTI